MVRIGENKRLGKFVVMEDDYGNRFTYAGLGSLSKVYAVPKRHKLSASDFKLVTPGKEKTPTKPATRKQLRAGNPEASAPGGSGKVATSSYKDLRRIVDRPRSRARGP